MDSHVISQEALFISGMAGCLSGMMIAQISSRRAGEDSNEPFWRSVTHMILAGYVAGCAVRPDSLSMAFSIGVALDCLVVGIHRAFLRWVSR